MPNESRIISERDTKIFESGFADDGHPWSWDKDYSLASDLSPENHKIAINWIMENIIPIKTPNRRHSSYGIKHKLQKATKIYTTNNQFKDLMLECGYMPVDEHELNWVYCISERSPVFKKNKR